MPVPYMDQVRRMYPGLPPYRWSVNDTVPLTPLDRPLSTCRAALVSSAGIYVDGQPPFTTDARDVTFREIPVDVEMSALRVGHPSTAAAVSDLNTVLPLVPLKELARDGVFRELASPALSFVGRVLARGLVKQHMIPWVVARLRALQVDAAFFVPV
jgi:hypothetical protein